MDDLQINFGDQESMRAAVPRVAVALQAAEQQLRDAEDEIVIAAEKRRRAERTIRQCKELTSVLAGMLEGPSDTAADVFAAVPELGLEEMSDDPSSKELALRVITLINGEATVGEVAEHMPECTRKTVSWALWKLASEGSIQKLKHGIYAPNGYVPGQPTTNYFEATRLGMPTPSSWPLADPEKVLSPEIERRLARVTSEPPATTKPQAQAATQALESRS
jgi:hypothetical protein